MFERWLGDPKWGLRVWRVFFGLVVMGAVGGILFGGWRAYQAVTHSDADPAQTKRVSDLTLALGAAMSGKPFVVPAGFTFAGQEIRLKKASLGYMYRFDPAKYPVKAFTAVIEDNKDDPVVDAMLQERMFFIPKGYPYAGEQGAVIATRLTTVDQRSGPAFKFEGMGSVKGSDWTCEGHTPCVDAKKGKSFDVKRLHAK